MLKLIPFVACCIAVQALAAPLPGTQPLEGTEDLASQMVTGIDRFLMDQTSRATESRAAFWHRDLSSAEAYRRSVAKNRANLVRMIGLVDARPKIASPELVATVARPALLASEETYDVFAVRWPALDGVHGEGLLLEPKKPAVAEVVAIPDSDQTPEMLCGLTPGIEPGSQFARLLAAGGCRVLVPMLIDRSDTYSITRAGKATNQPHREFIYRPAFEMGRTIIGYEVQKVLAAVDWFSQRSPDRKIGVIGYGEGGLIAFYAGALDERIAVTCVSGYFDSRQQLWKEPIYRNVFGLLSEFGDAEIASLVVPRRLIVEACASPTVSGPPAPTHQRSGAAPGQFATPSVQSVTQEVHRARQLVKGQASLDSQIDLTLSGNGTGPFGSLESLQKFVKALNADPSMLHDSPQAKQLTEFDPQPRLARQVAEMSQFTQRLMHDSDGVRAKFWARADRSSPQRWEQTTHDYRDRFERELIGKFDLPLLSPNVRSRQILDEPKYRGYEIVMDVFPDVIASGILLVPKDMGPSERRPVVVCQHGLEGRARDVADPRIDHKAYHHFACRLSNEGFVTYSPQNPYIFGDRFRDLQRKANPLGKSLYSIIIPQHRQATEWLASLPFVDPQRIAFYGLSYGGKTAMRVPSTVPRYCLSICSGDFNEWVWKNTTLDSSYSYVGMNEYEMVEWNLGNTFNYAEMAGLICPRPFMVERGHHDGVAPDEWVAYEYAKVRLLYSDLHLSDRTAIEFFDGPHEIHGVGTFQFLHQQLHWPDK